MITFKEAALSSKPFAILKNDFDKKRFSHAYLLVSADQEFAKSVFLTIMQHALCENNACGICSSCQKIENENHIDSLTINGSENKIKVEDIKKVIDSTFVKGFESDKKFNLILHAENMTLEAQNKLLKTLEEPTHNVHFLITATNQFLLLPTLRSRCKTIEVFALDTKIIQKQLEQKGFDKKTAQKAAETSMGNLSLSQKLAEERADLSELSFNTLTNLNKSSDVLEFSSKLLAEAQLELVFDFFALACRDALAFKNNAKPIIANISKLGLIEKLSSLSNNCLLKIINFTGIAQTKLRRNVAPVAVVDEFLFNVAEEKSKCKKF